MIKMFEFSHSQLKKINLGIAFISLIVPAGIILLSMKDNITLDTSTLTPIWIMSILISFVLFYESRKLINRLKSYKLEVSEERILKINDDKKKLIFFDDIDSVFVYSNFTGRVKRIIVKTIYDETVFENYENMHGIADLLKSKSLIDYKKIYPAKGVSSFVLTALGIITIYLVSF